MPIIALSVYCSLILWALYGSFCYLGVYADPILSGAKACTGATIILLLFAAIYNIWRKHK